MKPIKLILTAFGPYKDEETIDFTELGDHRLFVVSGNTGAGKTTIFDAICYAIYGQASGDDRSDVRMLRSHFAEDEVHAAVEFTFELKGRFYRVFRQIPHVKAGNKSETGERHELYEVLVDRLEPLTDRQSKRPVDDRLQQLIGLTREQFSQIVMLPQGEFRKLLVSDTDNKGKILRNIFKTSMYLSVETELDERRRTAKQGLEEKLKVRTNMILNLSALVRDREDSKLKEVLEQVHHNVHQVLSGLEDEIDIKSAETKQHQQKLAEEIRKQKQLTEQFHQAKSLDDRFKDLNSKLLQLVELEKKVPEINEKKRQFEAAKQAKHIQVHDEHHQSLVSERKIIEDDLTARKQDSRVAEQNLVTADTVYKQEEQNIGKREQLIGDLNRLNEYKPAVESIDQTKRLIVGLQKEVEESAKVLEQTQGKWTQEKAKKTELVNNIKQLEIRAVTYTEKSEKLTAMRDEAKMVGEYLKLHGDQKEAAEQEKQQHAQYQQVDSLYTEKEKLWIEGQASVLAVHLHDGKSCPVCGSTEHPNKAEPSEDLPSKEELDELKKRKNAVEQSYLEAKARLSHLHQQVTAVTELLTDAQVDVLQAQDMYFNLQDDVKLLNLEVEQLKADRVKLSEMKTLLEKCEKEVEKLAQQKDELQTNLQQLNSNVDREQALFEQRIHIIPEDIRTIEALTLTITKTENYKKQLDKAWKDAQKNQQIGKEQLITMNQQVEHLIKQEIDTSIKLVKAKESLDKALVAAGFLDYEDYQRAKLTDTQIAELEKEVIDFQSTIQLIRKQIEDLQIELKEKPRPELDKLQEHLNVVEEQVDVSRTLLIDLQSLTAKLIDIKGNIETTNEQVKETESNYNQIKDLYDMIRGDNPMKVSFERYLQIEFLEQIIEAANQRFQQMSNGQYVLVRSDRLEKNGKQSGLGLDVFDHYTGQYRDVKTLSGGEKFNASLSLALGMADVIQAYQGGISIETMFIDEGFGSLDEESLNKAIEALVDLQQTGRMVGVISHVAELKQAIPAILEVTKTKEGYSHTRFMIS